MPICKMKMMKEEVKQLQGGGKIKTDASKRRFLKREPSRIKPLLKDGCNLSLRL